VKRRRETTLELARAYAQRANIDHFEAMVRRQLPEDAQFLADLASWERAARRKVTP
jgi:hypothetical protein